MPLSENPDSEFQAPLSGRGLALATACTMLAFFLAILGQSTLATAMPSIVDDLGGFDRYTWVATSYLVASVVAIPIAGRLSDLYGRRALFAIGIALFIIGSIPAALSQSMIQLSGFTAIQGAGAGIVMAVSFVAIADLFPPAERGKYLGWLGVVFGVAAVVGLILGGLISDHLTWRWIFFLNVLGGIPGLLPGQLEAIRSNPQDYIGASATPAFAEAAGNAAQLADKLLNSINAALASAISYVFLVTALLLVLSMVASLFLRGQIVDNTATTS